MPTDLVNDLPCVFCSTRLQPGWLDTHSRRFFNVGNYELAQLHWGLQTIFEIMLTNASLVSTQSPVNFSWWKDLRDGGLAWYPYDNVTGFKLDQDCEFLCPHRHFSQ